MGSALKNHSLALGVLAVISMGVHLPLLLAPGAVLLPHADLWMWPVFSLEWGLWSMPGFFPHGYSYGGFAPLTALRTALVLLLRAVDASPESYWIWAQLAVSFLVWAVYALISRLVGQSAAFITAFLAAVGLPFPLMTLAGLDTFSTSILFSFAALAIRGREENPLTHWSWRKLALLGVATGYAGYVLKSGLLVAPALLMPLPWLALTFERLKSPRDRYEHGLRSIALAALLLAAYIGWHGRQMGTIGGKAVLMDGWPNVQIALISVLVIAARALWKKVSPRELRAVGAFLGGATVGFMPNIIGGLAINRDTATLGGGGAVGLTHLLRALRELWMGQDHLQFYAGDSRYAFMALGLGAAAALLWHLPRRREFWPAALLGAINLLAYFRIAMTSPGASRYLHLLYPLYFLGVALLWQKARALKGPRGERKKRAATVALLALLTVSAQFLLSQRQSWRDHAGSAKLIGEARAAVGEARRRGFTYVWAPSHWEATPLTIIAQGNPTFVQPDDIRSPFVTNEEVLTGVDAGRTVGAYFPESYGPAPQELKAYGRKWIVGSAAAVAGGTVAALTLAAP